MENGLINVITGAELSKEDLYAIGGIVQMWGLGASLLSEKAGDGDTFIWHVEDMQSMTDRLIAIMEEEGLDPDDLKAIDDMTEDDLYKLSEAFASQFITVKPSEA